MKKTNAYLTLSNSFSKEFNSDNAANNFTNTLGSPFNCIDTTCEIGISEIWFQRKPTFFTYAASKKVDIYRTNKDNNEVF